MALARSEVHPGPSGAARAFPFLEWVREYRRTWLPYDVWVGLLAAVTAIPEAMGLAEVAGLPPSAGLYALVLPVLVYAAFGTSRELAIGPTGPVAALVAATLMPLAGGDPARQLGLAGALALFVGALLLLGSVLRLGLIESFVSRPVLGGYVMGSGVIVALTQLGPLVGAKSGGETVIAALSELFSSLDHVTSLTLVFGLAVLAALVLLRRLPWHIPAAAIVLVGATALAALLGLPGRGLETVGRIGREALLVGVPSLEPATLRAMLPGALAIFLLIFTDSETVARSFASAHGERVRPNRELAALGLTNLAAGLGAFPLGGSTSGTMFAERAGARTPLAAVVSALVVAVALLHGSLFHRIPVAVLNAVVLVAVLEGTVFRGLGRLWRFDRRELAFGALAFLGVLFVGFVPGLLLAVVVNIVALLIGATHPRVAQLGRVPGTDEFRDLARFPELRPLPEVLLVRVESALFFVNAARVKDLVLALVADERQPTRAVVLDLETVPSVDFTGCQMLEELGGELERRGIGLAAANPIGSVRDALRRYGLGPRLKLDRARLDIPGALEALGYGGT